MKAGKVAVIGSGISSLPVSWLLARRFDVTLACIVVTTVRAAAPSWSPGSAGWWRGKARAAWMASKVFQVSPFCEVEGRYRFQFDLERGACVVRIDYDDAHGPLLATAVRSRGEALTTHGLARAFVRHPWMTLAVILRIHLQALRLWLKGVPFFSKPLPPIQETTR